jgi:hypothetical protein
MDGEDKDEEMEEMNGKREEKNDAARERCRLTVAAAPREFFFAFD